MQYIDKRTKPCPFCGWKKQSVMVKMDVKYHRENYTLEDGVFTSRGLDCFEQDKVYIKCNKCHSRARAVHTPTLKNVVWSSNVEYDYNKHCYIKNEAPDELSDYVDKAVNYWNTRPNDKE